MKKIILGFFMLLFPLLSFAQITEGFEGATFPPTTPSNWAVLDNGTGIVQSWVETTDITRVHSGLKAAIIDRENIGAGNTSQDWLVTPQITVTANAQLRFFTRQTLIGNNGSTYEIRVSTNAVQNNQTAYTTIQTWTETTLNTTYNVYEEKIVSLAAYPVGTQLYIAFVKVNTQPTGTTSGDRWLIDDVQVLQQCLDPTILTVGAISPTTASLAWTNNGSATSWEVEVIPVASAPTGVGIAAPTNPFVVTGLTPGTAYKYYVRANCGSGNFSQWVGPFNFLTTPAGSICSSPIVVGTLPYSQTSNTNLYGDEVDVIQGVGACGAVPTTTNYLQGAEVFYSYTATFTGNITVSMTPTGVSSSLFVYNGCASFPGTCLAGVANTAATPRVIPIMAVVAGQTYVFVISSSTTPAAGIPYTLIIQQVNCTTPAALTATNIGTTTADLSWSNPSGATSWEVALQPAGSPIPAGSGVTTAINTNYPATGLTAATAYQYWVRADCGGGLFSAWAGPFLFNTNICNAIDRCDYTFRMTDSFGDGWNGARMEVRQNGVAVATIGATFTAGAGPINVIVPLCQTLPFELHWTVPGSFPAEVGVSVINNFAQTLYTKPAGTGSAPSLLYTTSFNCATPACLPPTALTATAITTTGATLGWNGAGATAWDVYLVLNGTPAPTGATIPTYNDIVTNPLLVTGLLPLTTYQFYVRVVCSPTSDSIWAGPFSFTTLPTCPQPTALTATGIGLSTANLGWTEAGTATQWEVFIQAPGLGVPTGSGILTSLNPYPATGLTSATNYEFYVRAVCSPTDSSTWAGPRTFRTSICNAVDQCNYTFRMTDSFGDGWNGNTMNITQNGIIVATIGATFTAGAGPINIVVPMCTNLPFELFWNTGGAFANEVAITVLNQLGATIFTKPAGTGAQGTQLYSNVVECTPLPCGRPITLGANTITQTTANLTWVQPGGPGTATSWEIVVQPVPLGYPTGAGVPATSPYAATGLTAGSSYEFYVRTNCGVDGFSNWSGPFVFNTPVANDNCPNAIVVPVNSDASCTLTTPGSVIGATGSLPATTCAGTANDDVWFQFTATSTKHYINFLNIVGSTTDLNHVVYSGTCGALVQQGACQLNNNSVISGLTIGNIYYIRVYTATATINQTTTFNVCVGTISTCDTADAFCANPTNPFIFPNTTGVPSEGQQACLFTNPNPTYYFMTVLQSGNLQFQISQNTAFDAGGNPTGAGLDVDFVAWGPFASNTAACGNLGNGCPTPGACPNNTTNPTFYPYVPGNIMDCSYSAAPVENFTIANAIAGQVYVVVITNFNGAPGFIKFTQTNFGIPGAGQTDCSIVCEVDLGPDQNLCGVTSVPLDSQLVNATATFVWKLNGSIIAGATSQTYTATQSGTYTCIGTCGPNDVQDTMVLNLGPNIIISDQPDYAICDDASNDGIATFDLSTLTPNVLLGLNSSYTYTVTYHYTAADALANINPINPAVPYIGASQTLYIRVVSVGSPQCNTIVPQNLVVNIAPMAAITSSDADNTICSNETATITVTPTNFLVGDATYSWTLNGVTIAGANTNVITPIATGTYEAIVTLNGCVNTSALSLLFTVNALPNFTLSGTNLVKCAGEIAVISVVPTNFSITDPTITYTWTLDNVAISDTTSSISVTNFGTYEVIVNNQGCLATNAIDVNLDTTDIPITTSGECIGVSYIITATPSNSSFNPLSVNYEWSDNAGVIAGSGQNTFNVTEYVTANNISSFPITFTVKITTIPEGCIDTQDFVVVSSVCTIQKGISPNGDGDNDSFDLRGLGVKQLGIFNRYGKKVYSFANYTNEWKGQSDKGQELPDGTYYFVIDQNSGETKTGWIYINK